MSDNTPVRAYLDTQDRLLRGDAPLLALNSRAGGGLGEPLAVPPLAQLAQLARRLGVPVARGVMVGDADLDLDLAVQAEPMPDGVTLTVATWRERQPWRSTLHASDTEPSAPPSHAGQVRWRTDAAMRLTLVDTDADHRVGIVAAGVLGKPLTHLFRLLEQEDGGFPILDPLAFRQGFLGQRAEVRASGQTVLLNARARLDLTGAFTGFDGSMQIVADAQGTSTLTDAFGRQLQTTLRAPLGRIVADADLIHAQADGPLLKAYVDYAADIASAGRHLMTLIDDLADLDAIEGNDFKFTSGTVDLADVTRRAAGLFGVRATNAGIRIEQSDTGDALAVAADFHRALQVVINLLGNAVRHSPAGGTVWMYCEVRSGFGMVTVADQGTGIAVEHQARIFEKFERLNPQEPGGSGLGLYIARRLARAMGGDIFVESALGEGARFTLTLPLAG